MNKSIRILRLPISIIKKIEQQNIYQVFDLVKIKPEALQLTDSEAKILDSILTQYKYRELISELETGTIDYPYRYLDDKYSLAALNFSTRAANALERCDINTISKLLKYIEEIKIYNIENLGSKSIAEVMEKVRNIVKEEDLEERIPVFQYLHIYDDLTVEQMGFSQGAINSLRNLGLYNLGLIRKSYLSGELAEYFNYKTLNVVITEFGKYFIKKPKNDFFYFKTELIENHHSKIYLHDIQSLIKSPGIIFNLEDFKRKVYGRTDLIFEDNYLRLPYLLEKIEKANLKEETEAIFLARFQGQTLQLIADNYNKTRERIRQIVRDRMQQFFFFYEEGFINEYNKYYWHPDVFKKLFKLDDFSYNVVKYLGKKHSSFKTYVFPEDYIRELISNGVVAPFNIEDFKSSLPTAFKPRIRIYGKSVKKMTKRHFLEYVIKHFVPAEGIHKSEIIKIANKVAEDNNLDYYYDKYIDIVTNTIQGLQNVRYYNYQQITPEVYQQLKQILYDVDSVYSCRYFYNKYKTMLQKIDIRDGYELHFLLRRLYAKQKEFRNRIDFRRQPMIALKGKAFDDVIIEKWQALTAPVALDCFVGELIEDYGYHPGTLINVINSNLGDYISLRVLYHEKPHLSMTIKEKIKGILTDNFYELNELAMILKKHGIDKEEYQYFSNLWLNDLGYKTHDVNYIIKQNYESLKEVFFSQVLAEDEYKITAKDHQMRETTLILFIETLREDYLAFLVNDKLINIRSLEKKGITAKDVRNYVAALSRYLPEEVYFSYQSLLNDKYYLNDPALEKIEKMNLAPELIINFIRNVPGIKKTTKGDLFRISQKPTTLTGFFNHIEKKHHLKNKNDLKKFIKKEYGIEIRKNI
ncbi:MAG: hypothetical protein M0R05_04245 [Bacilli bacterium]|nr:hypothetical protein [Bacilli bacterium]MDD4077384.1 DNA-directed RNA polymerase subunit alpha C-terminal domain-containing protein [Bacilli bacterium]